MWNNDIPIRDSYGSRMSVYVIYHLIKQMNNFIYIF